MLRTSRLSSCLDPPFGSEHLVRLASRFVQKELGGSITTDGQAELTLRSRDIARQVPGLLQRGRLVPVVSELVHSVWSGERETHHQMCSW